ncbi:MAG: ABC transporter ATP-binding protein [Eubacteriaceae bacterium]
MVILSVKDLTKIYDNFKLEKVSFDINKGQVIGCIGDNGAGKTTLIKMLVGLTLPSEGCTYYFNKKIKGNEKEIKNLIGYIPDAIPLPGHFTAKFARKLFKANFENWDDSCYDSYLEKFKLSAKKKFNEMSKGTKVKFLLSLVFSYHPQFLILDEAISGLDPVTRDFVLREIMEQRKIRGLSIFMSTHILSDLNYLNDDDRVLVLKKGRTQYNSPKRDLLENDIVRKDGNFETSLIKLMKGK